MYSVGVRYTDGSYNVSDYGYFSLNVTSTEASIFNVIIPSVNLTYNSGTHTIPLSSYFSATFGDSLMMNATYA